MNAETERGIYLVLLAILMVAGITLYLFKFKKASVFFFIPAVFLLAALIYNPIQDRKQVREANKKIVGTYTLTRADTLSFYVWKGIRLPDSCRMILSKDLQFRIENCPSFIKDSAGSWTASSEGSESIRFKKMNKEYINEFASPPLMMRSG